MKTPVIRTYTGLEVNPLDLKVSDICVEDIAHSLALINRFNGQTRKPISVAQHSVYVSRLVDIDPTAPDGWFTPFLGLFHDSPEAYLGDVTKWLKGTPEMAGYRAAEERAEGVIYTALLRRGGGSFMTPEVEWADRVMVRFEGSHSQGFGRNFKILGQDGGAHPNYPPLTEDEKVLIGAWKPWSWRQAEEAFMERYNTLMRWRNRG